MHLIAREDVPWGTAPILLYMEDHPMTEIRPMAEALGMSYTLVSSRMRTMMEGCFVSYIEKGYLCRQYSLTKKGGDVAKALRWIKAIEEREEWE